MNREQLLELYRLLVRTRKFDEKAVLLRKQGRLGVYPSFRGHEGVQVAVAYALSSKDWVLPYYRGTALAITHGLPLYNAFLYWKGNPLGDRIPEDVRVANFYVTIASQCPQAVGLALSGKLSGENFWVVTNFGDGATSEGELYEAINLASVYGVKVMFVCENNGLAISVPSRKDIPLKLEGIGFQSGTEELYRKFENMGIVSVRVDGTNVLEVYNTVSKLLKQDKPVFLEAIVYRLHAHTTSDDPYKYLSKEYERYIKDKDPVVRFRNFLIKEGILDEELDERIAELVDEEISQASDKAENTPIPSLMEFYRDLI